MIKDYFLFVIALYLIVFSFYTFITTLIPKSKKIIFCGVCFTWFSVLILSLFFNFGLVSWAFMLGMSVTGLSELIREYKPQLFAVSQFMFTILGLLILMFLESKGI